MKKTKSVKSTVIAMAAVLAVGVLSAAAIVMQNNNNLEFHNFTSLQELEIYGATLSKDDINNGLFAVNNVVYENIGGKWMATSRTVNTYGGISVGKDGKDGKDGASAYNLAAESGFVGSEEDFVAVLLSFAQNNTGDAYTLFVQNGYTGTKEDFDTIINSLNGKDGVDGQDGLNGRDGIDGIDGIDGKDGLNGTNGRDGIDGIDGKDGVDGKYGIDGINGKDGKNGTNGTNGRNGVNGQNGADGADGTDGKSAYEIFVSQGFIGTETDFINTLFAAAAVEGSDNVTAVLSNYGFSGDTNAVMAALTGEKGDKGDVGDKGETGEPGVDGVVQVMNVSGSTITLEDGYWNIDNVPTTELARAKELSIEDGYFYVEDTKKGEATVNNADISSTPDVLSVVYEDGSSSELLDVSEIKDTPTSLNANGSVITYSKDGQETTLFDLSDYVPQCTSEEIKDANGNTITTAVAYNVKIGNNGNFWKYNYASGVYEDTGTKAAGVNGKNGTNGSNGISVGTIYTSQASIPSRISANCTTVTKSQETPFTSVEITEAPRYERSEITDKGITNGIFYDKQVILTLIVGYGTSCSCNQHDTTVKSWAFTAPLEDWEAGLVDTSEAVIPSEYRNATKTGTCSNCYSDITKINFNTSTESERWHYGYLYINPYTKETVIVEPFTYSLSEIPSTISIPGNPVDVYTPSITLNTTQLQKLYNKRIISSTTDADIWKKELYNYTGGTKWVYCGTKS